MARILLMSFALLDFRGEILSKFWGKIKVRYDRDNLSRLSAEIGNINYNRFMLMDLREEDNILDEVLSSVSKLICRTPFIDDVLVLDNSTCADARLRIFGGDGREAEFCGNGTLYTLSKLKSEGYGPKVSLETGAGIKEGHIEAEGCSIQIGQVQADSFFSDKGYIKKLQDKELKYLGSVWAGEPHVVFQATGSWITQKFSRENFEKICAKISHSADVEGGANVTVVFDKKMDGFGIRTFERGALRMTACCGSGSVAAVATVFGSSAFEKDQENPSPIDAVTVHSQGGTHRVSFKENSWWLHGCTTRLAQGLVGDFFDSNLPPDKGHVPVSYPLMALTQAR